MRACCHVMSCTRCSEPQSRAAGKPLCCKSRCASSSRVLLHAHQNGRAESTEANPVRQDFSFLFLHLNIVIQELIPPPSGKTWSRPSKGVGVVVQSLLEIFEGALFAHNLHSTQRDSQRQSERECVCESGRESGRQSHLARIEPKFQLSTVRQRQNSN